MEVWDGGPARVLRDAGGRGVGLGRGEFGFGTYIHTSYMHIIMGRTDDCEYALLDLRIVQTSAEFIWRVKRTTAILCLRS